MPVLKIWLITLCAVVIAFGVILILSFIEWILKEINDEFQSTKLQGRSRRLKR